MTNKKGFYEVLEKYNEFGGELDVFLKDNKKICLCFPDHDLFERYCSIECLNDSEIVYIKIDNNLDSYEVYFDLNEVIAIMPYGKSSYSTPKIRIIGEKDDEYI